eukprot:s1364_g9.t1
MLLVLSRSPVVFLWLFSCAGHVLKESGGKAMNPMMQGCGMGMPRPAMGGGCNPMAQQQMMMQQQQQMMMQQQQMMNNMMMGGGGCDMKKMQEMMNQMMGISGSKKEKKGDKSGKKKPKSNDMVIFVGGLRKTTEEDRVTAHFAKFGQVEQVDIKRLPDGTSRGFAFVKFSDHDAVEKVIDAHAKHMIDNKWVEVKRHDGIAASAGLTSSMQKAFHRMLYSGPQPRPKQTSDDFQERQSSRATEEPEPLGLCKTREEAEPPGEEFAEKWSEQYLAMASKLAENEKDGGGEKEAGKESGSSKKSPFEKLMKQMGMDPAVMKQMGMDPSLSKNVGMFKQMGIDPSMMTQMMGSPAENMKSFRRVLLALVWFLLFLLTECIKVAYTLLCMFVIIGILINITVAALVVGTLAAAVVGIVAAVGLLAAAAAADRAAATAGRRVAAAWEAAVPVAMVAWADVAQAAVRVAWALAVAAAVDAAAAAVVSPDEYTWQDAWDVAGLVAATSRRRPRTAATARGRLLREEVVAQVPGLADLAGPAARAPVALVAQDALLHTQLFGLLAQSFMGTLWPRPLWPLWPGALRPLRWLLRFAETTTTSTACEDPAAKAARAAAVGAEAAAFAQQASRIAETSRDAARDAATAKTAVWEPSAPAPPPPPSENSGHFRPPMKLWLPEPTFEPRSQMQPPPPPPPQGSSQATACLSSLLA